jgi:hypothetical protein
VSEKPCVQPWPAIKLDYRFADTIFIVEATRNEQHTFWERYSTENRKLSLQQNPNYQPAWNYRLVNWEQDSIGFSLQVGELDKRPVCVSFFFVRIDGQRVVFVDPTSQVVDHEMIRKWFEKNFYPTWNDGTRFAHCDSSNFHHCLDAVREANRKAIDERRATEGKPPMDWKGVDRAQS